MSKKFILKKFVNKNVRKEYRQISEDSKNKILRNEEMDKNKINEIERMANDISGRKMPKKKIKTIKKDNSIIERTEDCTVLITEDNKLMLND